MPIQIPSMFRTLLEKVEECEITDIKINPLSITLFLNDNLKFRIIDKTLYQLRIIEPERDYVEFKYSDKPERYTAIAREEFFLPLKYYLLFSSGLKIYKDHIFFLG